MILFRQKEFSNAILEGVVRGAGIGSAIGTTAASLQNASLMSVPKKFREKQGKYPTLGLIGAGTVIGAALGAIIGGIREIDKAISSRTNVDNRLMDKIITQLKKGNFKEGEHFTRDPRAANLLKTKACIAISRSSGELQLLINTISDPKLQSLTEGLVKNLPSMSTVTKKSTDRFNDISITTISKASADAGFVASIAERFIRNGYPVYLVEVG